MSKYIYKLSNYRAVKEAEIVIDGITVLAGENGSGKSTLSRWLYYIVKVLSEYESLIDNEAINEMHSMLRRMKKPGLYFGYRTTDEKNLFSEMQNVLDSDYDFTYKMNRMSEFVEAYVSLISNQLKNSERDSDYTKRLLTLFDMENVSFSDTQEVVEAIKTELLSRIAKIQNEVKQKKEERKIETFEELLPMSVIDDMDTSNINIDFIEDGVELLDEKHFSPVLNFSRAIYYKTYELMDYLNSDSDFNSLLEVPTSKMTDNEKLVYKLICQTIGGNVTLHNDSVPFFGSKQLYYKREDGLEFPLRQAATGIVSFSYLARLLENGYLRKGTLLIIDEPEAHLHPRWIVEYARILVLLQKKMDLKIVLSTHNPDMVAAIDSIARRENVLSDVNFYFAKPDTNGEKFQYVYERQESIGEIFDSFNIAISKIQAYGDEQ